MWSNVLWPQMLNTGLWLTMGQRLISVSTIKVILLYQVSLFIDCFSLQVISLVRRTDVWNNTTHILSTSFKTFSNMPIGYNSLLCSCSLWGKTGGNVFIVSHCEVESKQDLCWFPSHCVDLGVGVCPMDCSSTDGETCSTSSAWKTETAAQGWIKSESYNTIRQSRDFWHFSHLMRDYCIPRMQSEQYSTAEKYINKYI